MGETANIQHLTHSEIDKIKWDACINKAGNGLIYGYSIYLDHMAKHWNGLVLNDYETVMPLIWNKKYGITYCYQPPFTQQSGLFGDLQESNLKSLFKKITSFVKYGDWMFNYQNQFINSLYTANPMTNLVINLEIGYDHIRSNYNKDLQDNLKKAQKQSILYGTGTDINSTIDRYKYYYARRTSHVKAKSYEDFNRLCQQLLQNEQCLVREVKDNNGDLLASALLLKDKRRLYNIMNTTTDQGRKTEANHFLIDHIIREFAGQPYLFDLEGSDLPGIKKFYEKFGALNQPYYHWHYNNLPVLLRIIKK